MSISKVLFSFSGRISRQTYWLALLGIWSAFIALGLIVASIGAAVDDGDHSFKPVAIGLLLPMLWWCTLAVAVKRWHDRGKSGYWVLIYFVPVIGPFWAFIEPGFFKGRPGPNEFDELIFSENYGMSPEVRI
jgi:uncharacterized membrane protein YhaH (DUF805 family)